MSQSPAAATAAARDGRIGIFERYLTVWVLLCIAAGTLLGHALPGTFEAPVAPVYVDGRLFLTLRGDQIVQEFTRILDEYVETRYGSQQPAELVGTR